MAKLERVEHKVFASEAPLEEVGQFGSAVATTKLNTKDVSEIQALDAYTKGWGSAVVSENNYPAMEEVNGVLNVMSYHTGYLYQEGIPVYSPTTEYSATSIVKSRDGKKLYSSLKDGNIGNDLQDGNYFEELKLGIKEAADGQWVGKEFLIFDGSANSSTTSTHSLSEYLPSDTFAYEVLIGSYVVTAATAGSGALVNVQETAFIKSVFGLCYARASAARSVQAQGTCPVPIGVDRQITFGISGQQVAIKAHGYRRLGTNV